MTKRDNGYAFGTSEGWDAFQVARWRSVEEISRPYEFEITLLRPHDRGPVDLDAIIDAPASFRIAHKGGWRVVHGIVSEAEELDRTAKVIVYRVLLTAPIVRAKHRRRCRNFVDKTLKDVIVGVLENRSPAHPNGNLGLAELQGSAEAPPAEPSFDEFTEPKTLYKLSITDESRITDAAISPYTVQFNESDFDFLARLLEKEGISYLFEHTADGVVMVLTDAPGPSILEGDNKLEMRSTWAEEDAHGDEEFVRRLRNARRMRSSNVLVREFDFNRSLQVLEANEKAGEGDPDVFGAYEFGAEDENNGSKPGAFPAKISLERLRVERELRDGTSSVRTMVAGLRYTLSDTDHLHDDAELLIVRVETHATAIFPQGVVFEDDGFPARRGQRPSHDVRFTALPSATPFRPEQRTKKPRIHGIQTALVTAEEFGGSPPEINADKLGSVRVRFPWDQRANTDDGTPSSNWIRVSQYWAGISYGSLHTPRVGHEVLVAYLHGDPDRPVVVGRVYNAQNPPPYDPSQEPTKSTVKSQSSPDATGFNEIRFEDKAKKEEIYLHAQKDFNETVLNNHSTSVGGDQSNSVGGNQSNSVDGDRTHTVKGNEDCTVNGNRTHLVNGTEEVTVDGDRTTNFNSNETHTVASNETRTIGSNRTTTVGATDALTTSTRTTTVSGNDTSTVGGSDTVNVGSSRTVNVGAAHTVNSASYTSNAAGAHTFNSPSYEVNSTTASFNQGATFSIIAGGATLVMMGGIVFISNGAGASVALVGGMIMTTAGAPIINTAGGPMLNSSGGPITNIAGGAFNASGTEMNLSGGSVCNVTAGEIKLN